MNIDYILKQDISDSDKLEMILSNNIDLMYNGKACVSIDKWDSVIKEVLHLIDSYKYVKIDDKETPSCDNCTHRFNCIPCCECDDDYSKHEFEIN